jgi:hypothetical protein
MLLLRRLILPQKKEAVLTMKQPPFFESFAFVQCEAFILYSIWKNPFATSAGNSYSAILHFPQRL